MITSPHSDVETIQSWLSGVYTNQEQARQDPVFYIPVTLWYVPVLHVFPTGVGFFTEQINQHFPETFYRSRVLHLLTDPLRFENYKFKEQARWAGASQDPDRLSQIQVGVMERLNGCTIFLEQRDGSYHGKMQPGLGCKLSPEADSAVEIEFDLTPTAFITMDRGIHLQTGEQTWGSKAGPYHYLKQTTS